MVVPEEKRREWAKQLLNEVQANLKRLRECAGPHDFDLTASPSLVRELTCKKCGGKLNRINALWYLDGVRDGRASEAQNR